MPSSQLNPDREGYSRSVVVRVYQLESELPFAQADFDQVWQQSAAGAKAPAVVAGPEEFTVIPGRNESRKFKRADNATHLAVLAKFREHSPQSAWRAVAALPPPGNPCANPEASPVSVELTNYSLRVR